ncbi:reticulon-3-like isoform X1 [Astyanax mexicanus]|uniref:Reticulon n=2 Tax=Astyanax mexicanus TaxID=7994 RepID=A0A8T2LR72_ASTMX|nr:reticulon-3-like isoform X1 [Astyanax mexicanus]
MADPITQSAQISSSQGLNDGHPAASKDSKFSVSSLPSFPFPSSLINTDKRVVLGSDKPSEGVATSLRFSSQPSSFSPMTYGNESSGPPGGNIDRSFQEKRELFESSPGSQNQDSSPVKVSPVSERIKALEALAAKQNDSDWSEGGFPHFRERHYEKSPTEMHGISSRSSLKKRATSTEQDSPESPFEILGEVRRGSDFEDTADWMRAHLPPAPDFSAADPNFDEMQEATIIQESPTKEIKGKETDAMVPESFVGVPHEFMDIPTEVTKNMDDDTKQSKQDSVEEESEFDLRFLPTAYMWDKQEKPDSDAQAPSDNPENPASEIPASVVSPEPPTGFESPSMSSPHPAPQEDSSAKQPSASPSGGTGSVEIHEVDSSGESDDMVIEDASGALQSASTDAPKAGPCVEKSSFSDECGKRSGNVLVPIINVIETEEQNIISDYEVEPDDDDDDDDKYEIMREPTRPVSVSSEKPSEVSEERSKDVLKEEISSRTNVEDFDTDYSSKHKIAKDDVGDESSIQTYNDSKDLSSEDSRKQSDVAQNLDEPFREFCMNDIKPDKTSEVTPDLPPNDQDLSNELESSDIDTYLDHYASEELALKDQLRSGVCNDNVGESFEVLKSNSHQFDNQNNSVFAQQSIDEAAVDEFDEELNDSKQAFLKPEPSPVGISTEVLVESQPPRNETPVPELVDQLDNLEDQKIVHAPGDFSLVEEDDYMSQVIEELSSVQENAPAPFPSFHNDSSGKISEVISDFVTTDVTEGLVMTNSDHNDLVQCEVADRQSPEVTSEPENIEPECSETAATDSFVEFMRECLKSQQDEEPDSLGLGHSGKGLMSDASSSPAMIMDLEQERLTISALKELGSSQDDEDETSVSNKTTVVSSKEASKPLPKSESSVATPQQLPNEYQPDVSLAKEVEAIDILVAEAYHLAEHVLTAILTHVSVHDLVHWRDPKKTGVVFGTSLLLLLSLAAFSVISVISYLLLALLCVTITFRIYKSVVQAVQKSSEGHPFKALMEKDVSVPPETFRKHVDASLTYINRALKKMSRLFLVEDLVDSLKLAVAMWLLTYVGAVFNGITILILADILIFSVPPLYEKNKTQIDHYIDVARTQINATVAKLQEKLPGAAKRSKAE